MVVQRRQLLLADAGTPNRQHTCINPMMIVITMLTPPTAYRYVQTLEFVGSGLALHSLEFQKSLHVSTLASCKAVMATTATAVPICTCMNRQNSESVQISKQTDAAHTGLASSSGCGYMQALCIQYYVSRSQKYFKAVHVLLRHINPRRQSPSSVQDG